MTAAFRRQAVPSSVRSHSELKMFPAPTKGWVTNANLANAKPQQALTLENFFPTQTSIQPRGGRQKQATIGSVAVQRVFHYVGPAGNKLFAADATKIFDITSPGSPTVPPASSVSGQTSGYYSTALVTTSGGTYLKCVNGADFEQMFDGTAWTQITAVSVPAITGSVTTDKFSSVWVYSNRVFYTQRGTLNLLYLPIDSIAGAIGVKALGGIFKRGGELLFGATWSRDSGDGINDYCVVVTTEGEMAVFLGGNPAGSSSGDFDLVGRYDISKALGKNATMSAGGDLLIATEDGMVPVSEALNKDVAALSLSAVSRPIEPDWQMLVRERSGTPWEVAKWPSRNMAVVSLPAPNDAASKICLPVNVETGAWCKYTNWDVRSLDVFSDQLYFGDRAGVIWKGETTGKDAEETIYCTYVGHADHLGTPGVTKTVLMMRSTFQATLPFNAKVSASVDYTIRLPAPPSVVGVTGEGWDLSVWDTDVWDASAPTQNIQTRWTSIGVTGFAVNPQLQVSSNSLAQLDIKLVTLDLLFEMAGIVV